MTSVRTIVALGLCAALLTGCAEDFEITLENQTNVGLVPYPVVTVNGAPQRQADPAGTIPAGQSAPIDPTGFNPLYYVEAAGFAVTVQLALDSDPAQVLVRTTKHVVPPGQEGGDPANQPVLLDEALFEPAGKAFALIVQRTATGLPVTFEER